METGTILSIVLAISTVAYTVINFMMWLESRATRKQKMTPQLIAFLKPAENHQVLCVYIKNIGEGCAKDVRIKVLKDYNQFGKEKYSLFNITFFRNGANIFPPQYELMTFIDFLRKIDYESENSFVELKIQYKDTTHKNYSEVFKLPFNQVVGGIYSDPPETYMGQIPYYLKEINNSIKHNKN